MWDEGAFNEAKLDSFDSTNFSGEPPENEEARWRLPMSLNLSLPVLLLPLPPLPMVLRDCRPLKLDGGAVDAVPERKG